MSDKYWKPGEKLPSNNANKTVVTTDNNSNSNNVTSSLSKSVMGMKFMKRKLDVSKDEDVNKRRVTDNSNNDNNNKTSKNIIYTNDNNILSSLPGRRSYGGYNKVIERHYEYVMNEMRYEKTAAKVNKNTINDEEMAKRYTDLIKGPNKKNTRYYIE